MKLIQIVLISVWYLASGQIVPAPNCCVSVSNSHKLLEITTASLEANIKGLEKELGNLQAKYKKLDGKNAALQERAIGRKT